MSIDAEQTGSMGEETGEGARQQRECERERTADAARDEIVERNFERILGLDHIEDLVFHVLNVRFVARRKVRRGDDFLKKVVNRPCINISSSNRQVSKSESESA